MKLAVRIMSGPSLVYAMTYYDSSISGCRLTKIIRPMCPVKALGSTIASGVHCLVHDVNICLSAFQFGRLIAGFAMSPNGRVSMLFLLHLQIAV